MPITQKRMLQLITAAEDYQENLVELVRGLNRVADKVAAYDKALADGTNWPAEPYTRDRAYEDCQILLYGVSIQHASHTQIAVERAHFNREHKRNDYLREKQTQRRYGYTHHETKVPKRPSYHPPTKVQLLDAEQMLAAIERGEIDTGAHSTTRGKARVPEPLPGKDAAELAPAPSPEDIVDI